MNSLLHRGCLAEEKYAGNQLAVIRGGAGLPDETLQKLPWR